LSEPAVHGARERFVVRDWAVKGLAFRGCIGGDAKRKARRRVKLFSGRSWMSGPSREIGFQPVEQGRRGTLIAQELVVRMQVRSVGNFLMHWKVTVKPSKTTNSPDSWCLQVRQCGLRFRQYVGHTAIDLSDEKWRSAVKRTRFGRARYASWLLHRPCDVFNLEGCCRSAASTPTSARAY
jgi:hypothetical protein